MNVTTTTWQSLGQNRDVDVTIIHRILSLPDRPNRPLKKELKLLICNAIISCKFSTI